MGLLLVGGGGGGGGSFVCFGRGLVSDCEGLCGNHQNIGSGPGAT